MKRILLVLGFCVIAPARAQESFADFAFAYFARQKLEAYAPHGFSASATEAPLDAEDPPTRKRILALYAKSLKGAKVARWTLQQMAAGFKLPAAGIGAPFENDVLVKAYGANKKLLAIFRPVATVTGCDTGCLPVVFHLKLNSTGAVQALIEDPERPLTKAYHAPLSAEDRKTLLRIAQQLPKALEWVDGPSGLADAHGAFPPSTWSPWQATLVPGAAYTSYRVYEAALGASRSLRTAEAKRSDEAASVELESAGAWLRTNDAKALREKLLQLKDAPTRVALRFAGPAVVWTARQGAFSAGELADLIGKLPAWSRERRGDLMALYRELLREPKTSTWIVELLGRKNIPFEPENLRRLFVELAKAPSKTFDLGELELFSESVLGDSMLLARAIERLRSAQRTDLARQLEATRAVRYARLPESLKFASAQDEATRKALAEARGREQERKLRGQSPEKRPFPSLLVTSTSGEKKTFKIPYESKQSLLYVFFAAWCPHCQTTVGNWVKAKFKASTWERIRLLEVFPADRTVADFCKLTQLDPPKCAEIASVGDLSLDPKARADLGIEGVPRLLVVDGQQRVRFEDLHLPTGEGVDVEAEILSYLQAAEQP